MGESRETTIILAVILLVLVGALVAISVSVYSIVQTTGDLFEPTEQSKVPSVFQKPNDNTTEVTPTPDDNFNGNYGVGVGQEGAYRLFDGVLSYNVQPYPKRDLPKNVRVDLDDIDEGLYFDLNKKHIIFSDDIIDQFYELEIPSLEIRTNISQGDDPINSLKDSWWMLPSDKNSTNEEKIIFCQRNAFDKNDFRTCYFIDYVKEGDNILIYSEDGSLLKYKVISKSIEQERVETILRPSANNYLRIISSSDIDGHPDDFDYRVVILAQLIEDVVE